MADIYVPHLALPRGHQTCLFGWFNSVFRFLVSMFVGIFFRFDLLWATRMMYILIPRETFMKATHNIYTHTPAYCAVTVHSRSNPPSCSFSLFPRLCDRACPVMSKPGPFLCKRAVMYAEYGAAPNGASTASTYLPILITRLQVFLIES